MIQYACTTLSATDFSSSSYGDGDYQQGNCQPSVANAATYYTALYGFVRNASNNSSLLAFAAYDEPAKDPTHTDNAENYYGLFDSNCYLKNNNVNLLPNPAFQPAANAGCQGYTSGVRIAVVGTQPGSVTNQPTFIVNVSQVNPVTGKDASMCVTVTNQNRSNMNINPWPYYLIFNGATITISGITSRASCQVKASVNNAVISYGAVTCTNPNYVVNCSGNACYLPFNNF